MDLCRIPLNPFLRCLEDSEIHSLFAASSEFTHRVDEPARRRFFLGRSLPRVVRVRIWRSFFNPPPSQKSPPQLDPSKEFHNLTSVSSSFDSAIRRDVGRTMPWHEVFEEDGGVGQRALTSILHAVSLRLYDVGYCQGMNFLAATLFLVVEDEETAFEFLVALLMRYNIADYYRPTFPRLSVASFQLDVLVEAFLPDVHASLARYGITAEYYALQWFLTLFAHDLPQGTVWMMWDLFLQSGWKIIFQVGLALLENARAELIDLSLDNMLRYLKDFVQQMDIDGVKLLAQAKQFSISNRMLAALEAAFANQQHEIASGEAQPRKIKLFIAKDLDTGDTHWSVQSVVAPKDDNLAINENEQIPSSFNDVHNSPVRNMLNQDSFLPFLMENLDTKETTVMEDVFDEHRRQQQSNENVCSPETVPIPSPANNNNREQFWVKTQQENAMRMMEARRNMESPK